jgi:O-antigen ligase
MVSALLYLGGLLVCVLSLGWPQIGLYYIIPLMPLQTIRYGMHRFPLGGSMIDLVLLGVIVGLWLHRDGSVFEGLPLKKLLVVFAIYLYIQLWHGSLTLGGAWPISTANVRVSLWKNLVEMPFMYAATFAAIRSAKQIRFVVVLMCLSALLVGGLFFLDMHKHDLSEFSSEVENAREAGVMGYAGANGLAAFEAGFALFLLGFYTLETDGVLRYLVPITLLACGYGVIYTFSRGAYLAVALGVLFLGVLQKRTLLVLGLAGMLVMPGAVMSRIGSTFVPAQGSTDVQLEGSAEKRLIILENAMGIIAHNPVIGIGFETYQYLHPVANLKDTHDFYLKLAVEEGAVGMTIFLMLFWKMFRKGLELSRKSADSFMQHLGMGLAACMVGMMVVNLFGDRWSYPQVDTFWWVLLALVCRAQMFTTGDAASEAPGDDSEIEPESVDLEPEFAGA